MPKLLDQIPPSVEAAALRGVFALPRPLRRRIAGRPLVIDGQELALDAQLLLALQKLSGQEQLTAPTPEIARAGMRRSTALIDRSPLPGVEVTPRPLPGGIQGRLYRPHELNEPGPLLVFYHGGGWVIGDLDSHDDLCRFLAKHAGIRVLSVDYRLAPEHPFPNALDDSIAAFEYAVENAAELGTRGDAIAVGGDSAGGNLAASVSLHTPGPQKPVFQLLIYPATDASTRRPSRSLFGKGLLLTDTDIDWFLSKVAPEPESHTDPRFSVLLAEDHTGLPPAYVVTAGFDPLRDEGEAYARKLSEAGVPVISRRFPDLIHGFANLRPIGGRFQEALFEMVGTLRAGLELHGATLPRPTEPAH